MDGEAEASFAFDDTVNSSVQEYVYNAERNRLTVYLSGRESLPFNGEEVSLGTISVTSNDGEMATAAVRVDNLQLINADYGLSKPKVESNGVSLSHGQASATPAPTEQPTVEPTVEPTAAPTVAPTVAPTAAPTVNPTAAPSVQPTSAPVPSAQPSRGPTASGVTPTQTPAPSASVAPSAQPSADPSAQPSQEGSED